MQIRPRRFATACLVGATVLSTALFASRGVTLAFARPQAPTGSVRPVASANPLGSLTAERLTFDGGVIERLAAGSYTYLRVAGDDGEERWIVVVGEGEAPGVRVRVRSFGARSAFHSKRLERSFDLLHFALTTRL